MTITLLVPCFTDALFPRAGISMVQILERLGHRVQCPEAIACCGQPPFNSGYWPEARTIAVRVLDALKDAEAVVIGSGSCGAMVKKFYPELFAGTPQAGVGHQGGGAHLGILGFSGGETGGHRRGRPFSGPGDLP